MRKHFVIKASIIVIAIMAITYFKIAVKIDLNKGVILWECQMLIK